MSADTVSGPTSDAVPVTVSTLNTQSVPAGVLAIIKSTEVMVTRERRG